MKVKSLLSIFTFSITAAISQIPNYVPANGLQSWYPFNGDANDNSVNAFNGIVNGSILSTDRFGITNSAYSFDGVNDYISAPQNLNNYSVSLWFFANSFTNQFNNLFDYENSYAELTNDSTIYARTSYAIPPNIGVITTYKNNLGQWHHLVVNYDATLKIMDVYLDNINNFTSINAPGGIYWPLDNNDTMYFGGYFLHNTNYFSGKIDDIGIWNRSLTPQEITNLYNGNICYQNITVTDTLLINMGITGFNPVTYQNTLKVWPNPTKDHITIDNGNLANLNGYQIKIMNSLSQQVFQSAITQQQFYIDLSSWTGNGIYFVHIIDGQGNTVDVKKIILQ